MLELIRAWILGIAGTAAVCALAVEMTPQGAAKNATRTVCGIVMAIALINPLLGFDPEDYSLNLSKYRKTAEELTRSAGEISDSLSRTVIEEDCRAYILDKANSLGAEIYGAEVTVSWSGDGVWYPVQAELSGAYDAELSRALESELGIARERQIWITDEGG